MVSVGCQTDSPSGRTTAFDMEWNSFPTHSDLNLPQVRRELFQERTGAKSSYATPYDAFVALVEKIVKETNVFASRLLARMTAQGLMRLNSRIARWKDTNVDEILDESLVQWCGWLSFKQFIKDKAAAVGIKTYEVCESETGYLWRFEVHADKLSADPKVETEVAVSSEDTLRETARASGRVQTYPPPKTVPEYSDSPSYPSSPERFSRAEFSQVDY
ncbi:hypothetical protein EVAR_87970_1 [Eumeta japonica]|uniref:PiggyBac transposable element-derived protein domain-containing protein n=1 Tax=Eumeta variegata TaxID=151549 RepID=A0A4C1VC12_EUMVA|nr:hypothetical protein EVAR_87970_1 [Eumeta japonica]